MLCLSGFQTIFSLGAPEAGYKVGNKEMLIMNRSNIKNSLGK